MTKQYYNKRIGAWVKGKTIKDQKGNKTFRFTDVKKKNPKKPFKGITKG